MKTVFQDNCGHPTEALIREVTPRGRYCAGCADCEQVLATADDAGLLIVKDPKLTEEARGRIERDFLLFLTAGAN